MHVKTSHMPLNGDALSIAEVHPSLNFDVYIFPIISII